MALARSLRRLSPLTLLFSGIVLFGLYYVTFSGGSSERASKLVKVATHHLSPPTSPYQKQSTRGMASAPPVTHYYLNNVTTTADPQGNKESILILTPMARFYTEYWDNLLKLSYPHELISLGFILPKSKEGNTATAALQAAVAKVQKGPLDNRFASVTILREDFEPPLQSQDEATRHKKENQKERRASMSIARNSLLFTTLGPTTSWVLWLDSDIVETPPSLIQDLARFDKPIIVPNCFQRYQDDKTGKASIRPYDYNSWIDSETAQKLASKMGPDEILLEGYHDMPTYRTLMARLWEDTMPKDKIIQLDGVGGTALLVKAEVHRDGAMFPPFSFYHLIETEGFAKMAKRLGWQSWGLPGYLVYHYNE